MEGGRTGRARAGGRSGHGAARTDYGDIRMDIVDYNPGTGQRLRP